jgi:hypothetical protein
MRQTRGFVIAVGIGALLTWGPPMALQAQQDPAQLEQLVAPIALYPDDLAADVLAAATYPSQVDEAAQWLQQNGGQTPDQIATSVDKMDWDSSVKALTEFPVVLAMMDQNLSWTSALGDAYFNQPDDVMDAVQALRQRAIAAGTLQSNAQITVSTQDGIIVIQPASPDTEYVPSYDCWTVFGGPIDPWPEFVFGAGFVAGPHVRWDAGFHITGQWGRVNWGLHNWGFDWSNRRVNFRRDAYVSHSPSVVDRHYAPRPAAPSRSAPARVEPGARPGAPAGARATVREPSPTRGEPSRPAPTNNQPIRPAVPVAGPKPVAPPKAPVNTKSDRGFVQPTPPSPPSGTKSTVFTGINHGGVTSNNASRGQSSMGARPAPQPASRPPAPPAPRGNGRGRGGL